MQADDACVNYMCNVLSVCMLVCVCNERRKGRKRSFPVFQTLLEHMRIQPSAIPLEADAGLSAHAYYTGHPCNLHSVTRSHPCTRTSRRFLQALHRQLTERTQLI